FSRFTKPVEVSKHYEDEDEEEAEDDIEIKSGSAAEGLIEALGNLAEGLSALGGNRVAKKVKETVAQAEAAGEMFRVYMFKNLDQIIVSAKNVQHIYHSENTLYKNPKDSRFYLYLTKNNNSETEFVRTCNLISEYGSKVRTTYATPSHMEEHYKIIIDGNALQTLSKI
ncbi:MAG: adaptor protein MecA, partial [Lachnospiraceae bacterium]|nr:adaptor protein MecA [Lachnospiraceae bacterium]